MSDKEDKTFSGMYLDALPYINNSIQHVMSCYGMLKQDVKFQTRANDTCIVMS